MGVYGVGLAVLLLPLVGVLLSYLSETRRGIANTVLAASWLCLVGALVLLIAVIAQSRAVHSETLTFWSFSVVQKPFNAATRSVLAETFKVGVGYAANPVTAVLALLVATVGLLGQLQLAIQFRREPRLGTLSRLSGLLVFSALLVVLAPELFQVVLGFELCGLTAALLVGSGLGARAGGSARSAYLSWRLGAMALLLAVAFIYTKFSGPVASAAAAAAAKATKSHPAPPAPDGLNLNALEQVWWATTKGLTAGVGGRTLVVAAVLLLLAGAGAAGMIPLQGIWRHLGRAPGAASALVLAIAAGIVGPALLLQGYTLLRLASGVLPALTVLAGLSSLLAAALALRESNLRRLAIWISASQTGAVLVALGLGSRAAALALLISASLTTVGLLGVVSSLGRELRVDSVDQLGAAWKLARRPTQLLLLALAAAAGVLGLGTFFGHAALLAASFGAAGRLEPAVPPLFRVVGALAAVGSTVLVAAAAARVGLVALRGEEPADPREARLIRRSLSQARGLRPLWPSATAIALALLSGVVALPSVGWGIGALLSSRGGRSLLPLEWAALLLALLLPLAGLAGAYLLGRGRAGAPVEEESTPVAWLDGTRLALAGEAAGAGLPSRALDQARQRLYDPVLGAVEAGLRELVTWEPSAESRARISWGWSSGLALIAGVALAVAIVLWVTVGHGAGAGLP